MHKIGSKNYFKLISNPVKLWLLLSFILPLTLSIASCFAGPNRSIGIDGEIGLSTNKDGLLCFQPLFDTTNVDGDPVELKYLKMKKLSLIDFNVPDDQSQTVLTIVPVSDKFYILEKGQKICLNTDDPKLEQHTFKDLKPMPMVVLIGGVDDKDEIIVNFSHEFDYSNRKVF